MLKINFIFVAVIVSLLITLEIFLELYLLSLQTALLEPGGEEDSLAYHRYEPKIECEIENFLHQI